MSALSWLYRNDWVPETKKKKTWKASNGKPSTILNTVQWAIMTWGLRSLQNVHRNQDWSKNNQKELFWRTILKESVALQTGRVRIQNSEQLLRFGIYRRSSKNLLSCKYLFYWILPPFSRVHWSLLTTPSLSHATTSFSLPTQCRFKLRIIFSSTLVEKESSGL